MLSGAALAVVLGNQASAVEPALVGAAVNSALLTAAGQSASVSANVLALSEGVVKTMFLNKLKVIAVLAFGVLLGFGAGLLGVRGALTPAIHAAAFADADQPAPKAADPEPLDGHLLLQELVQKELKLSKNQIGRIQAISQDVDLKSEPKQKEIKELQKQIEELRKRMDELGANVNTINLQIEEQRTQTIGKAAPEILSDKAVTRLRQIQRQKRYLNELLADAKIQRMLKIDDEQVKKIEMVLKTESFHRYPRARRDGSVRVWDNLAGSAYLSGETHATTLAAIAFLSDGSSAWNERALQKLFDVLSPAQQRTLTDWLGEPYEGTSWHALRAKAK